MAAEKTEAAAPPVSESPEKKKGGLGALLPALLAIVLAPALSFGVAQFVLIPQLRKELAALPAAGAAADAHAAPDPASSGGHGKAGAHGAAAASPAAGYTFENIVVNLAGSMGTRYLKATFLVTGEPNLKTIFDEKRPVLVDVTINVLSSLSLADLEEAGSKNVIREKLVQSYNQALGRKVAEQVFFSDFVVQ